MGQEPNYLTTEQVARRLGKSVSTINRWAASGKLSPAVDMPGRTGARLYRAGDVLELMAEAS